MRQATQTAPAAAGQRTQVRTLLSPQHDAVPPAPAPRPPARPAGSPALRRRWPAPLRSATRAPVGSGLAAGALGASAPTASVPQGASARVASVSPVGSGLAAGAPGTSARVASVSPGTRSRVASEPPAGSDNVYTSGLLGKVRFPKGVAASLLGVTLFLIGDGLESVWITDFAHTELGYELGVSALLLTFYGVVVAIGSFLSMALADAIGPRRIMLVGLVSFAVFDILFITVGIPSGNFALLVAVYSCRGLGYPFFAMGFFAWLMKKSKPAEHGPVSGWFFFAYSLGLQILGSYAASFLLPRVGEIGALWAGLGLAMAGGGIGLGFMRGPGVVLSASERRPMGLAVVRSLSIIYRVPKIAVCSVIGAINLIGPLALSAFYVTYLTDEIGLAESSAVLVFTIVGIFAVIGNVVWGNIGNALGWTNVVRFGAGPLCATAVIFFYYAPKLVGPNFAVIACGGVLLGFGISAFIPLNALFLAHSRGETGSALAASGLARGLASFLGPALTAAILSAGGYTGVVWTVAGLYLSILVLGRFIRLPGNAKITEAPAEPADAADAAATAKSAEPASASKADAVGRAPRPLRPGSARRAPARSLPGGRPPGRTRPTQCRHAFATSSTQTQHASSASQTKETS